MGRPELGTKCACANCAERFYDLNRSPAVCPKCGAIQPPVTARALRPARSDRGSTHTSWRPLPVFAEEEVEPVAAAEDADADDADDAVDVPEIDADVDADVDPVIVRD